VVSAGRPNGWSRGGRASKAGVVGPQVVYPIVNGKSVPPSLIVARGMPLGVRAIAVPPGGAAGTRIADLSRWLGGYPRIARAMPNTPALVGAGISGVFAPVEVNAAGRKLASRVLEAAGAVVWVDREEMLDAVTGVSGSGPAYVFYFLEGLEQAARELGFSTSDARKLAYTTFAGALKLAQASDLEPAILRAQVTSKGGTTERALTTMEADGVKAKFIAAVKAAAVRAHELGDEFGK